MLVRQAFLHFCRLFFHHDYGGCTVKTIERNNTVEITLFKICVCVLLAGLVCLFCLLLGLGFTTTSGNYWFTMFNDYGANFSLLFIVLIEVITVSYIYGIKRFVYLCVVVPSFAFVSAQLMCEVKHNPQCSFELYRIILNSNNSF